MNPKFDIVVVGAGPAGMMAAIAAAPGRRVAIIEQLPRGGTKLLATGGGHCNLSNTLDEQTFMASFGRQGRFLQPALAAMGRDQLLALLAELGVPTHCPDGLRIYPVSNSAADVEQALWQKCMDLGVTPMLKTRVTGLLMGERCSMGVPPMSGCVEGVPPATRMAKMAMPHVTGVQTTGGEVAASAVILATGGKSYPQLGATGVGYELARQAGHTIVQPLPALAALLTRETWPTRCMGVGLPDVRVWIDRKGASKAGVRGEILFTHTGLSGPAMLNISGEVSSLLAHSPQTPPSGLGGATRKSVTQKDVTIRLNFSPDVTAADWMARFDQWRQAHGTRSVVNKLAEHLPHSLAAILCEMAKVARPEWLADQPQGLILPPLSCAHMDRAARQTLAGLLTAIPLTVRATEGFDKAMVTRGGVKLQEVDPHTLQSKLAAGLYFAGEILDLDGPSGGFNLQAAFSMGYLAGKNS